MAAGERRGRITELLLVHVVRLAGLLFVVVGVYSLVVLGIGRVPTSREWTLLGFSALAAVAGTLLYAALRSRLDSFADRLFQREEGSTDELLRSFGGRAARGLPVEELLLQLAESLRGNLSLASAEIWTSADGALSLAACDPPREQEPVALGRAEEAAAARAGVVGRTWLGLWLPELLEGAATGPLRIAPMAHAGDLMGLVVVARDGGRQEFGEDDDQILAALARQAALALHDVRLGSALEASMEELRRQADELRASRARVVAAADAERRRIERDLHDGAQQHLVGMVANLQVARELLASDPVRARGILDELSGDVHASLEEIRDLAQGIYPPLLLDRGLADAMPAAFKRARLRGRVDVAGVGRYPVDLEATVYFCCLEAIQNAAKHAGSDARVVVRIWEEDATLLFEISDDGPGFGREARSGMGLTNMRDRVGALGGRLRVESGTGEGTRIVAGLPLGRGAGPSG